MFAWLSMDMISGAFFVGASIAQIPSIIKAHHLGEVKGYSIITAAFFAVMPFFQIFMFQALNQPLSMLFAILLTVVNTIWFFCVLKYSPPTFNGDYIGEDDYGDHEVAEQIQQSETFATQATSGGNL